MVMILNLERPFATVLIGDPFVVDVHEQTDRSVILEPLDLGATNLVFVDAQSIAIANVRVLVCASATPGSLRRRSRLRVIQPDARVMGTARQAEKMPLPSAWAAGPTT